MLIFFFLLAAYVIASSFEVSASDEVGFSDPLITIVALFAIMLFVMSLGFVIAKLIFVNIKKGRRFLSSSLRSGYLISLLVLFFVFLLYFHWRYFLLSLDVAGISLGKILVVKDLLLLLPAFLFYVAALFPLFKLEKAVRREKFGFAQYADFQLRLLLAPLPLIIFISLFEDLANLLNDKFGLLDRLQFIAPTLTLLLMILPVVLIAVAFPFFIRFILRTKKMPDDELHRSLKNVAAIAGVKFRRILIWETRDFKLPNAMVVGFFAKVRYVFITDAILQEFTDEQIEAVFAHELGHAKKGHLLWYFSTLLSYIFFEYLLVEPALISSGLAFRLEPDAIYSALNFVSISLLVFLLFLLLGVFSRRFERQADLFGAKLIGHQPFAEALYGIDRILGGNALKKPSLTHGSLESRILFILRAEITPELAQKFENRMKALFTILALFVASTVVFIVSHIISEIKHFEEYSLAYDAADILDKADRNGGYTKADTEKIRAIISEGRKLYNNNPLFDFIEAAKLINENNNLKLARPLLQQRIEKLLVGAIESEKIRPHLRLHILDTYFKWKQSLQKKER